jgi:hypothetical protein
VGYHVSVGTATEGGVMGIDMSDEIDRINASVAKWLEPVQAGVIEHNQTMERLSKGENNE